MVLKDKKTNITFHSGILTIGGTVIEVSYGDAHIFFDFGTEYKPELELKDESLGTLIEHRLVPELENIYDPRLNYSFDGERGREFEETAVFLSHVHLDHTRMVNYLDPKIPMYALKETKVLLESLNSNNDFILPCYDKDKGNTRNIIACDNEEHVKIGDIDVQLLRVDHDAYGACGLLIKTPDLFIAYTGDLRLHGFDSDDSLKFANEAKNADVLIIEGVSVSFLEEDETDEELESTEDVVEIEDDALEIIEESFESEQELVAAIAKLVKDNPKRQITFNAYPANIKRLAEINKQSSRKVVFEASFAHVLKECLDLDVSYYQNTKNEFNLKEEFEVDYELLIKDKEKYLWQVVDRYNNLRGGGVYIHSNAIPLGEFDPAYIPFIKAMEDNNIEFHRLACSGHAKPEDLDRIIDLIEANLLVPIHSLKPELLENPHGKRYLPIRGETI